MSESTLVSGYHVTAYQRRVTGSDPAMVVVHRLGSDERGFLTPMEATALAKALLDAAEKAKATP